MKHNKISVGEFNKLLKNTKFKIIDVFASEVETENKFEKDFEIVFDIEEKK